MSCPECGNALVKTTSPLEEEYKGVKLTIDGISRLECEVCGEYIISAEECDKLEEQLQRKYRETMGLLQPEEIVELRKKRGWTQKELEQVLGVTSPSVSRWETGRVVQSKVCDNLMRCLRDYDYVACDLDRRHKNEVDAMRSAERQATRSPRGKRGSRELVSPNPA